MDIIVNRIMESEKKNLNELSDINLDPITFFDKDEGFILAFKKTEKLTSALYIVTNLFSDNEPIKWTLRKKAADLLSFILTYKDRPELSLGDFIYNARTKVLELVSFLEVCLRAGLVSQMNFSIIKNEFSNLTTIFSPPEALSRSPLHQNISKTFFDISNDPAVKDMVNQALSFTGIKDKSPAVGADNLKRSNRQNTILGLLKKKKDLNIKDISEIIKDCSEKTIQRELNSFISMGVLRRVGVRRWSRYSLAG